MVNIIVPFIISIVTILLLIIILLVWMARKDYKQGRKTHPPGWIAFIAMICIFASVSGLTEHPGLWLFLQPGTLVFNKDGKLLSEVGQGQALWRWSPEARGHSIIQMNDYYHASYGMSVQPITQNPKVRELRYEVVIAIGDNSAAYQKFVTRFGKPELFNTKFLKRPEEEPYLHSETAQNYVRSLLYEFNEEYSGDLAKFYNPLSDEQQEKFANLVSPYIEDKLAGAGLEIRSIRFSLP